MADRFDFTGCRTPESVREGMEPRLLSLAAGGVAWRYIPLSPLDRQEQG